MSASPTTSGSLADYWGALATCALLGTDRHPRPDPPPGAARSLEADHPPPDDAVAVLDQIALLTTVRRAGLRPSPAVARLEPCPADHRPVCPPAGAAVLARVLADWPQLLDEWLARLDAGGWRLPPELACALLAQCRNDARRPVIAALAGPVAGWITGLFPGEFAPRPPRSTPPAPEPPLPDDIAALARLTPDELATTLASGLERGVLTGRHRPLLVRLVCELPADHLGPLASALSRAGSNPDTMGLALTLSDLAQTRLELIRELSA
jgi:hypothetical protein